MVVFFEETTSRFDSVPLADGVRGTWKGGENEADCGKVRWLAYNIAYSHSV